MTYWRENHGKLVAVMLAVLTGVVLSGGYVADTRDYFRLIRYTCFSDPAGAIGDFRLSFKYVSSDLCAVETAVIERLDLVNGNACYFWTPYKNGSIDGKTVAWDQSGQLLMEETYVDDWRHGPSFCRKGAVTQIGKYAKGQPDGLWRWLDSNGNLLAESTFTDGTGTMFEFWPDGVLRSEQEYVSGVKRGRLVLFYPDGTREASGSYRLDFDHGFYRRSGEWTEWHPNGQLKSKGHYDEAGEKTGVWIHYDRDGNRVVKNGQREK